MCRSLSGLTEIISISVLTGDVAGTPLKGLGYENLVKIVDHLKKVDDYYTVTMCHNGFLVEVCGLDSNEERSRQSMSSRPWVSLKRSPGTWLGYAERNNRAAV